MSDFAQTCTGCGACADECPFLTAQGTPDQILTERPEASFYCASCRRCDYVCPLDLSPSAAFAEAKKRLIREGRIPPPVQKALNGAKGFAKTGHGFPFSFYDRTETVFWPGCGLAASNPLLVRRMPEVLSRHLQQKVGLALDCCFDPVMGLGDAPTAETALRDINKLLLDSGVKKVITGCLNCHKLLSAHLRDVEVVYVLEALPVSEFQQQNPVGIYLHHPCPSSRWREIPAAAKNAANRIYGAGEGSEMEKNEPLCCGLGCGLKSISPELSDRFLEKIVRQAEGRTVATYCAGCQNRFLQQGMKAVHLLECLTGEAPRQKVTSPAGQWLNRLSLAASARIKTTKLLALAAVALLIAGGFYLKQQGIFSADVLKDLLETHPVAAPAIFLLIYAFAPALFLPSIPITLAAGFFWGPVWGVVFSITGATLGACLPFFLSRYLFQDAVKAKVPEERWNWLQDKVAHHGWKAVAFTRLIPVFPFNLLNYLFGLTPIAFFQYLWSTFIFMLPACIAFVAFGSSLSELIMRGNVRGVVIGVVIAVCAFLIPLALRPFFRKVGDDNVQKKD